jgi:pimeloyl-ACP methyl ester carboxylesterase
VLVDDIAFQSRDSRTLVVTFAGMAGILRTMSALRQRLGIETRPFEFVHSLEDKECDVLFLRDRYRSYYHLGVKGVGRSIDEVSTFLNDFIKKGGYDFVITLGHSMGGYASILFASRINADFCVAISAPTFLDPDNRTKYGDDRYSEEKAKLCELMPESAKYLDLGSLLLSTRSRGNRKSCSYLLFYGENDRLDRSRMQITTRRVQ